MSRRTTPTRPSDGPGRPSINTSTEPAEPIVANNRSLVTAARLVVNRNPVKTVLGKERVPLLQL